MEKPEYNPSQSLIFLTNRVGRLLGNCIRKRAKIKEHGLIPHHIGVLVDLWMKDGVRQQDLAISTIKNKATITRALDYMEKNNIVVRVTDENDKRNKRIYLTHKGRALKEELMSYAGEVENEATEGIREEELVICKKVLMMMYFKLNK